MKGALSLFLLFIALLSAVNAELYGLTFTLGGDNTLSIVETVEVSSTGKFTPVVQNFVYVGDAATVDGISAFDSKNGILYFTTDFESAFVYSVNAAKGLLMPTISISAQAVSQIVIDTVGEQLLITGVYGANRTEAIIGIPASGAATEVFNFTANGFSNVVAGTLDTKGGIYYFVYLDKDAKLNLGQFPLKNPQGYKSAAFPCAGVSPVFLTYDNNNVNGLVGYSFKSSNDKYYYTEIVNGKCTTNEINARGIITSEAYDPTVGELYLSIANNTGYYLGTWNGKSLSLSISPADGVLTELGVTYKS